MNNYKFASVFHKQFSCVLDFRVFFYIFFSSNVHLFHSFSKCCTFFPTFPPPKQTKSNLFSELLPVKIAMVLSEQLWSLLFFFSCHCSLCGKGSLLSQTLLAETLLFYSLQILSMGMAQRHKYILIFTLRNLGTKMFFLHF